MLSQKQAHTFYSKIIYFYKWTYGFGTGVNIPFCGDVVIKEAKLSLCLINYVLCHENILERMDVQTHGYVTSELLGD